MVDVMQNHPVYFRNDDFDTNMIQLWFPLENDIETIAERTILPSLLMKTNRDYPEEDLMDRECSRKYIITMTAGVESIGTVLFLRFTLQVPKKKVIPEINLEDCIRFFQNTILYPNVKNGIFPMFEIEQNRIRMNLKNCEKDKSFYAYKRIMNELNPGGFLCNKLPFYPEQLESLTSVKVFDYYRDVILNNTPFIFLFGSSELNEFNPLLEKEWNFNRNIPKIKLDCNDFLKHRSDIKLLEDEMPFQESILTMVYKVKNMEEEDRIPLMVISRILSSQSTNLLMTKLRDEAKLVYHAGSSSYSHFGLLTITCGINQDVKDESIKKVKETVKDLYNIDFLEKQLMIIQERTNINLMRKLDEKYSIFYDHIDQFFGVEKTTLEESEIIMNMKPLTLINLLDRFELDLVYFLKGIGVGN